MLCLDVLCRRNKIAQRDLYAVLELEPGATAADVKAAYRKLARTWHPDKNPQDTQVIYHLFLMSEEQVAACTEVQRRGRVGEGRQWFGPSPSVTTPAAETKRLQDMGASCAWSSPGRRYLRELRVSQREMNAAVLAAFTDALSSASGASS